MAKKSNMYEKFKIMDNLLRTLNSNITEERHLLSSLRSTTEMYNDLIRSNQKQNKESYSRQESKKLWSVDNIKIVTDNIVTINDTLVDIREILEGEDTKRQHDNANPLSGINAPESNGSSSGNPAGNGISKYVDIAKSVFIALGLNKILSSIGKAVDKSIDATYSVQQITGLNESAAYAYKRKVNDLYKGNKYTTGTKEYDRLATIAATTGMDDMDRLLKYSKSIAVGVESMGLDTSNLAELLYTIEKRGTFTSAQLDNVIDTIYKYSAGSGEVTPEELEKTLTNSLDGLMYGLNMSNEDYQREMEEVLKESATIQGQGFSAEYVSQLSNIINDILLNKGNSQYVKPLAGIGITYDDIGALLSVGDYSGAMELIQTGLKNNAVTYGDDLSGLDVTRATALGINYNNETRRLLQKYDGSLEAEIQEMAESYTSAEDAANDMTRSLWKEGVNSIENFFSPVVDWFSSKGIGSTEFGITGGIIGALFGKKAITAILSKLGAAGAGGASAGAAGAGGASAGAAGAGGASAGAAGAGGASAGAAGAGGASAGAASASSLLTSAGVLVGLAATSYLNSSMAGWSLSASGRASQGSGNMDAGIASISENGYSFDDYYDEYTSLKEELDSGSIDTKTYNSRLSDLNKKYFGKDLYGTPGEAGVYYYLNDKYNGSYTMEDYYKEMHGKEVARSIMMEYYNGEGQQELKESLIDAAKSGLLTEDYLSTLLTSAYGNYYYIGSQKDLDELLGNMFDDYKDKNGNIRSGRFADSAVAKYLKTKSYAQGTAFLPQDGLIYAHAGEAIIPAQYNPVNNISTMRDLQNDLVTSDDISAIYDAIVEMKSTMREFFNLIESKYTKDDIDSKITDSRTQLLGKKYGFFGLLNK